jgi:hypothetical protein
LRDRLSPKTCSPPGRRRCVSGQWKQFRNFQSAGQFVSVDDRQGDGVFSPGSTAARDGAGPQWILTPA